MATDAEVRFQIGWIYTAFQGLSLILSFTVMILLTLRRVEATFKAKSVKLSKAQIKRQRRKSRAMIRQVSRMHNLQTLNSKQRYNNVIPVTNVESFDGDFTDRDLNGSARRPQVIMQ